MYYIILTYQGIEGKIVIPYIHAPGYRNHCDPSPTCMNCYCLSGWYWEDPCGKNSARTPHPTKKEGCIDNINWYCRPPVQFQQRHPSQVIKIFIFTYFFYFCYPLQSLSITHFIDASSSLTLYNILYAILTHIFTISVGLA